MNNKKLYKSKPFLTKDEALKQYNKNQKLAVELVEKYFPEQKGKGVIYKDIHSGYTNFSFLAIFENGDQYQIRIPHDGDIINRKYEYDILFNILNSKDYIFYDKQTGVCIKKWFDGKCPSKFTCRNHEFLDKLFNQIKKLHNTESKKIQHFDKIKLDAYNENLYRLKFVWKKKFLCLIDRRRNDKLVLNHTDINPLNIIYNPQTKGIKLIDYEWTSLASDYYDYANFVRETGIKYKKIDWSKYIDDFNMELFEQYLFISSMYSYLWTYAMPQSIKIAKYRLKTLKQIRKYYPAVINVDKSCYINPEEKENSDNELEE